MTQERWTAGVTAMAVPTVGSEGWDGFVVALVEGADGGPATRG